MRERGREGQKLTWAQSIQVGIPGWVGGAELRLRNARALHELCFPQRGWEQTNTHTEGDKAHTDTRIYIREMEGETRG